jgi:hypothetical protein
MMIVAAAGVWQILAPEIDGSLAAYASERSRDANCMSWDKTASETVAAFVQDNAQNVNLVQVSHMIAQMRRARRNCELGWLNAACEDYQTIVRIAAKPSLECKPMTAHSREAAF